jgi:hypothetical protein
MGNFKNVMARKILNVLSRSSTFNQFMGQMVNDHPNENETKTWVPPGHFYSPIASMDEIKLRENAIFENFPRSLPGIELREDHQLNLLEEFIQYYRDQPFQSESQPQLRYCFENDSYSYSDALFLHFMIRHVKPNKFIEVGSGRSSCVTLDTNELFFDNTIDCTFIDPYPQLLESLLKEGDRDRIEIFPDRLQGIDLSLFQELNAGDILFIDSTHVSKVDSDVNCIFFNLLPSLKSGVYIHFHDIFYPFEYPKHWVYEGRSWTECYLLRAFLSYNPNFEVYAFNTFLEYFHEDWFAEHMPLCLKNKGGSIWLRKR